MNYCGQCADDIISEKEIYNFLQKALRKVNLKNIYWWPKEILNENFCYKNKNYGNIKSFYSEEEVYYKIKMGYFVNCDDIMELYYKIFKLKKSVWLILKNWRGIEKMGFYTGYWWGEKGVC